MHKCRDSSECSVRCSSSSSHSRPTSVQTADLESAFFLLFSLSSSPSYHHHDRRRRRLPHYNTSFCVVTCCTTTYEAAVIENFTFITSLCGAVRLLACLLLVCSPGADGGGGVCWRLYHVTSPATTISASHVICISFFTHSSICVSAAAAGT